MDTHKPNTKVLAAQPWNPFSWVLAEPFKEGAIPYYHHPSFQEKESVERPLKCEYLLLLFPTQVSLNIDDSGQGYVQLRSLSSTFSNRLARVANVFFLGLTLGTGYFLPDLKRLPVIGLWYGILAGVLNLVAHAVALFVAIPWFLMEGDGSAATGPRACQGSGCSLGPKSAVPPPPPLSISQALVLKKPSPLPH